MGERMTWLSERRTKAAALALVGGLSLVGCTSGETDGNPDNNAADRMECTAEPAGEWQPAGDNFNDEVVSKILGVDAGEIAISGTFGPVTCPKEIEVFNFENVDEIGDILPNDGRIIMVTDQGPNCFVYNKHEDEKTGLALCVDTE
jgi:hypothetical protein